MRSIWKFDSSFRAAIRQKGDRLREGSLHSREYDVKMCLVVFVYVPPPGDANVLDALRMQTSSQSVAG